MVYTADEPEQALKTTLHAWNLGDVALTLLNRNPTILKWSLCSDSGQQISSPDICAAPSLNTQSCLRRTLCSTLKYENLSISLFQPKIKYFPNSIFFTFMLCNFLVWMLQCCFFKFLPLKTFKKRPQKLLIIGSVFF